PKLTEKDTKRKQEIADIQQAQGSLETGVGKPYDVSSIVDLSWEEARKL
ncbi:ABC transporter substrate-binding protein, partial [Achromobacter xylosoxidans]